MSWTLISKCVTRANPHHSLGMVLPPIHTERLPREQVRSWVLPGSLPGSSGPKPWMTNSP